MVNKFLKKKNNTMRNSIKIIFATLLFIACNSTTKNLGDSFVPKNTISVHTVTERLKSESTISNIQIEGKIEKSCTSEGCWFTIKDDSIGNEILFDVKDKKFRVPTNSSGKTVIVLADASIDSTSEQKFVLSVKGLMFK